MPSEAARKAAERIIREQLSLDVHEIAAIIDEAMQPLRDENAKLRELLELADKIWRFDNHQQHTHSWHNKQWWKDKVRAVLEQKGG